MTINRNATAGKSAEAAEAFIGGAPGVARKDVMRGRKEQFTNAPGSLMKIDEMASGMGQSRSALIDRATDELAVRADA